MSIVRHRVHRKCNMLCNPFWTRDCHICFVLLVQYTQIHKPDVPAPVKAPKSSGKGKDQYTCMNLLEYHFSR